MTFVLCQQVGETNGAAEARIARELMLQSRKRWCSPPLGKTLPVPHRLRPRLVDLQGRLARRVTSCCRRVQHLAVAIVAPAADCRDDRRHARFRGYKPHRNGRPIVLDVRQEQGEIQVELRLLGTRKGFTTTIEGLFDMAARQAATNELRDRRWQREQRRVGRPA